MLQNCNTREKKTPGRSYRRSAVRRVGWKGERKTLLRFESPNTHSSPTCSQPFLINSITDFVLDRLLVFFPGRMTTGYCLCCARETTGRPYCVFCRLTLYVLFIHTVCPPSLPPVIGLSSLSILDRGEGIPLVILVVGISNGIPKTKMTSSVCPCC